MIVKGLIEEDFVNYKKSSMFIAFPTCTFKCEKDCGGEHCCQNSALAQSPNINIDIKEIVERYMSNPITHSIVCAGLEPMDSWEDLKILIEGIRYRCDDDIVIYSGYTEKELKDKIGYLKTYKNIIVKFGRFIPNQQSRYDEVLGVYLASDNQYAIKIS